MQPAAYSACMRKVTEQIVSGFSLCLGLSYGIYLLLTNIFRPREIRLAAGLLGNVLGFVLQKPVSEFVQKDLDTQEIKYLVDINMEERSILNKEEDDKIAFVETQNSCNKLSLCRP